MKPSIARTTQTLIAVSAALLMTAGCGEKSQEIGSHPARKGDTQAWAGGQARYTVGDWKAGDEASWEQQIKARTQTQNEYNRVR